MMLLMGPLLLAAASVIWAEEQYYLVSLNDTWDNARNHCQKCYKDLTTITPGNVQLIQNLIMQIPTAQNFTAQNITAQNITAQNRSSAYWIGLRQNFSGFLFWSQWSNGAPVIYQNWYPGRPILKKMDVPMPTSPPPTTSTAGTTAGTTSTAGTTPTTGTTGTTGTTSNLFNEMVQCPALKKLIDCLNGSDYLVTPITHNISYNASTNYSVTPITSTTSFSTTRTSTQFSTSTPALLSTSASTYSSTLLFSSTSTSLITSAPMSTTTVVKETDFDYIEDSCVALLSFGMWREKHCYEILPFICYDDRFFGEVSISNVTHDGGFLSWSQAPGEINHYRVEQNRVNPPNTATMNVSGLNVMLQDLVPGTQYNIKVIPVKCNRDLNPQNISFSTLPKDISNVSVVSVERNSVVLNWSAPIGGRDSYSVNWLEGANKTLCTEKGSISPTEQYNITGLYPGQLYSFAICAVVNKTIFGEPGRISVYTKPSRVDTLISANNMSSNILAWWNSSDRQASDYSYHVLLIESSTNTEMYNNVSVCSTVVNMTNLTAGSQYNLTVSAIVKGSLEGETLTIEAYTTPETVNNLTLTPTYNSIKATWDPPNGSYYNFSVELYLNSMSGNASEIIYTKELQQNFSDLKSTALYFVKVITHVKLDKYPSKPASDSCYTPPVPPANVSITLINGNTVDLKWEAPKNSEGVKDLKYNVTYKSFFWGNGSTSNETGINNKTIYGLQTGTKYNFGVSVYAGQLQSSPTSINYTTETNYKNVTLMMQCSSATSLYCKEDSTKILFQRELEKKMGSKFGDQDIVWRVKIKEGK